MANLTKLKEVRVAILEYPENFKYNTGLSLKDDSSAYGLTEELFKHNSNTCGCVAGFTCSIAEIEPQCHYIAIAKAILELDVNESGFLFFGNDISSIGESYLSNYSHPEEFDFYVRSTAEGLIEALRRLDFMVNHYSKLDC